MQRLMHHIVQVSSIMRMETNGISLTSVRKISRQTTQLVLTAGSSGQVLLTYTKMPTKCENIEPRLNAAFLLFLKPIEIRGYKFQIRMLMNPYVQRSMMDVAGCISSL
ncbi:hypothetical protein [Undibacterium sp. TC9W]|uniref:hypothetical protein n=1 Tax=Undibacterium sp. TC9W TaxID=3413053 RepID=UPI003BF28690